MIQMETELPVADNTGARLAKCIKVLGQRKTVALEPRVCGHRHMAAAVQCQVHRPLRAHAGAGIGIVQCCT